MYAVSFDIVASASIKNDTHLQQNRDSLYIDCLLCVRPIKDIETVRVWSY